jgi:hypothetical protein
MSTFPQILPTANADPSHGEQNTAGFPDESKNLPGVFEKMMTQALSTPPANSGPPKEENQPPQTSVQPAQIPAHFSNKMPGHIGVSLQAADVFNSAKAVYANVAIQSKGAPLNPTDSKATTQASASSNKDKKSETSVEPASMPASLETFLNQVFAAPVLTVDPIGKSGGEKAPKGSGSPAPSPTGVSELSVVSPAPTRASSASSATAKVLPPQLSTSQLAPTMEPNVAQQTSAAVAKEIALPAKNLEPANPASAMAVKPSSPELPEDQTALGSALQPGNKTDKVSDSSTATTAQPQPEPNGTSIAKQDVEMKQAEKTNKIAGQTEKVLPGNVVSTPREGQSPGVSLNAQSFMSTTAAASSPALNNIDGMSSLPSDSVAASAVVNARSNSLERTQELVMVNATRLSDSGNNSMQVVIKPDAGTQLSLELRQQSGNVEVQATLQQGDFNHLNQQWPDLQQRLEERGIRLSPLTDDGASGGSNTGNETFENKQNQANEVVPELKLVDAPAGMFTSEPAQTSAHRGWETWA